MSNYTLPHFGDINTQDLEEYYDASIEFNDGEIEIDLNFENKTIDPKRLDIAKNFIENIAVFDKKNKEYIEKDYADEEGETVKSYLEFHLEELGEEDLAGYINPDDKTTSPEVQLKNSLRLVRMGLYPDSEEQFAIFDYSIGTDLTNHLVVIFTDENGNLEYMTMES